jgi:ABC-type antimicrobial peptide transport system permease subunit
MAIRSAMGATRSDLIRLVIGGGAKPVIAGIVLGFAGAVLLTRFVESMLFATPPIDPPTFAIVIATFIAVALIACLIPAWRAASTDPMSALRQE